MFTGIIQTTGELVERSVSSGRSAAHLLRIRSSLFDAPIPAIRIGDSIAVNGVCLTVTEIDSGCARFDIASETERKTTLGLLAPGAKVNLERSLRVGDPLDGHLVQGHVDQTAAVLTLTHEANTVRMEIELPQELRGLVVPKGSITVDGVSLTVGECQTDRFSVYLIPHTFRATTFSNLAAGQRVNLEADCIARYLQGIAAHALSPEPKK
ncbi:MAG: riboflavin synthase [Bdellovibrionota bacterium]